MFNSQKLIMLCMLCLVVQFGYAQPSSEEMKRNVEEVKVRNTTSANTTNLDFSPAYYQNGIVFASSRFKAGKKDKNINETFFELFYAETDGSGDLLKPRPFSLAVNSYLHEGPVTFNRAGDKIFFTRNNIKKGFRKADKSGVTRLKIYEAQKGAYDWTSVNELPFNSDEYSCAHPTLSADETKLYFASDRPGGQGGMDIWMVTKNGDAWGEPTNLGPEINTPKNDAFPFIHSSGNLIFTSNGHNTKGGYDLFLVDVGEGSKSVYNLGAPFNTASDDLGLILSPDGRSGYFTSARTGGKGKDDIYFFEAPNGILGETTADVFSSTITIYDLMDKSLIEGAAIRVFEKRNDGFLSGGNDLYEAVLMPSDGDSGELVFKLIRKDAGSLSAPDRMSDAAGEAVYDFMGEKEYMILVTKEGYASKEMTYSTLGNISNSNIRIPLDKTRCTPLTGVVRNKSTNRVMPGAIVKLWNGCSGSDEEVLADKNGSYEYCLKPGCDYMVKGVKASYSGEFVKIGSAELSAPNLKKDVYLTPPTVVTSGPSVGVGTVIVLENIYYDFNKSFIRTGAARELDELLSMMNQYPTMNIELISHTDSRGDSNYNLNLSQRRAESAKQYLVARGVSSSRVRAVGYGESQPRNQCVDGTKCSEEEHQYNRRTEVKVTSISDGVNVRYNNNAPEVIDRRND